MRPSVGIVVVIAMMGVLVSSAVGVAGQAGQAPQSPPTPSAPGAAPVKPKAAPSARPAPKPHAPGDVEVEPIACWWKTDRNAVNIGERFTVTLTCSVVETTAVKVVPDLNQLEATTVALQPFEVVKGVRHEDIRTPPLRYIQYQYTTRLVGDVFFGKDVDIPGVKITYHIQSSIGGGSQGRDQTYALPALAMRVNSLVPKKAADIRDNTTDTFADIESRRLRSSAELVASAIAFGFALVLVGLALVRVVGRYRVRTPSAARPLPVGAVLRGCQKSAAALGKDVAREGCDERARRPRPRGVPHRQRHCPRPSRRPGNRREARRPWRRPAGGTQGPLPPQTRADLHVHDVRDHRANARRHERTPAQPANGTAAERAAGVAEHVPRGPLRAEWPARHGVARRRVRARHRRSEEAARREPLARPDGRFACENRR